MFAQRLQGKRYSLRDIRASWKKNLWENKYTLAKSFLAYPSRYQGRIAYSAIVQEKLQNSSESAARENMEIRPEFRN